MNTSSAKFFVSQSSIILHKPLTLISNKDWRGGEKRTQMKIRLHQTEAKHMKHKLAGKQNDYFS
jgi:hypothetical protein